MTTLFGPHLLQAPNTRLDFHPSHRLSTFQDSIRGWKPPVCLLTMDILDEALSKDWNERPEHPRYRLETPRTYPIPTCVPRLWVIRVR